MNDLIPDSNELLKKLEESGGMISGSFILQCIYNVTYDGSDIDIYHMNDGDGYPLFRTSNYICSKKDDVSKEKNNEMIQNLSLFLNMFGEGITLQGLKFILMMIPENMDNSSAISIIMYLTNCKRKIQRFRIETKHDLSFHSRKKHTIENILGI